LTEEIVFDGAQTSGIKNIFELTTLIQRQLQSITFKQQKDLLVIKPFQQAYVPLIYNLELNNKSPLQNFPFIVECEDENINVNGKAGTNEIGELQLKINSCEAIDQTINFILSPDISGLLETDSLNKATVALLQQFIQTPTLKVKTKVQNVKIYINSIEKNLGKVTNSNTVEQIIRARFNRPEIKIVNNAKEADYTIESVASTEKDISSDVFENKCKLKLAALTITLQLKNSNQEVLYNTQVDEIYGYANSLESAGINAYSSPDIDNRMAEALFFLKRKIVVY
jgi:hypothetical protein